ncbi:hypothetical protein ABK040_008400 [Willaertia magna]
MRVNIRQRKIDLNKPLPIIIANSLEECDLPSNSTFDKEELRAIHLIDEEEQQQTSILEQNLFIPTPIVKEIHDEGNWNEQNPYNRLNSYYKHFPDPLPTSEKTILYDIDDEDVEWLERFISDYKKDYNYYQQQQLSITKSSFLQKSSSVHHNMIIINILQKWKVQQFSQLPHPSIIEEYLNEDFLEEAFDRFEKATGTSRYLCSLSQALLKFPSIQRYFHSPNILMNNNFNNFNSFNNSTFYNGNNLTLPKSSLFTKSPSSSSSSSSSSFNNPFSSPSTTNTTIINSSPSSLSSLTSTPTINNSSPNTALNNNNNNNLTDNLINNHNNIIYDNLPPFPFSLLEAFYNYWKEKRLSRRQFPTDRKLYPHCGRPLTIQFEIPPDPNDNDSRLPFRPSTSTNNTKKASRKNDVDSYIRMRQIRKDLMKLKEILQSVKKREELKLKHCKVTRDLLLKQIEEEEQLPQITNNNKRKNGFVNHTNGKKRNGIIRNNDLSQEEISNNVNNSTPETVAAASTQNNLITTTTDNNNNEEIFISTDSRLKQDENCTQMNLLYFLEVLKKRKRPVFPFLMQVKKLRPFLGDESIPEQFDTSNNHYEPGSEYQVRIGRDGRVLFDFSEDEAKESQLEKKLDDYIDNLWKEDENNGNNNGNGSGK